MRYFSIILIFIFSFLTACNTTQVLTLKHKRYYSERNILTSDTTRKLIEMVFYNKPHIMDEEFFYKLTFKFIDTTAAKQKRLINLVADTTILKCYYSIFSIWNWSDEHYTMKGDIEIVEWKYNSITLKENVFINDIRRKKKLKFKGKRTFIKHEGW